MAQKINSFERFWKELKRRKTGKVIIAYAATAFIILQLADILTPALSLPTWTTTLVTLLLVLGFPLAVLFSWIFDITPEGIKKTESIEVSENKETIRKPVKKIFSASNIIIAVLIIVVAILAYPKIFKRDTLEKLRSSGERISVAVMPFQNMTNDTIWNIWQDGIQDILITSLSNSEELKVRQAESINNLVKGQGIVNYASITPSVASTISQKLDANVLIYGSIKQAGSIIRLYTQLIDPETEEVFKSFQIEGLYREENIFHLIDSLSVIVRNFLIISELEKEIPEIYRLSGTTNSPEAYRYFIQGRNEYMKEDYLAGINWFSKAIAIDSNFFQAMISTSLAYNNQYEYETWFSSVYDKLYLYEEAKKWCLRAYGKMDQMTIQQKINTQWLYARFFETKNEEIKYLKQLIESDDQWVTAYFNLGNSYYESSQYEKAIPEYEKALKIYEKWGLKPYWAFYYTYLGQMYHKTGQYKKEEKVYKRAEKDFPDDLELIGWQGILALSQGDTVAANRYFERFSTIMRNMSFPEASIKALLAFGYNEAGVPDKAEEYYRLAQLLESDNPDRVNNLSYFLIDKDRNINEGVELIDKVLMVSPENFIFLHTKGWGLFKQGKYKEALEILQKSWDLRRQYAVYDHEAYLHLEEAKKAVVGQN
jgi:tetratricopeptide (TPR) repeat protein